MKIKLFILTISLLWLNFACNTKGEKKDDPHTVRHSEFEVKEEFFIGKDFNFKTSNVVGFEIPVRSEKELDEHLPEIKIFDKGAKVEIKFPNHPQLPKHYWAWVEVVDQSGTEVYKDIDIPKEEVKDFKIEIVSETPFKLRIRIRAFCFVHGEFITYVDVPDYREKNIIDK